MSVESFQSGGGLAHVFLSYAREDERRARQIANALEEAGHEVWWDRDVASGTRYTEEIQQALNGSAAVVVLWSKASVTSAWVRDEAAAGRDARKLVPARIDEIEPPLGFRQYQTSDLARWRGHKTSAFQDILRGIAALAPSTVVKRERRGQTWRPSFYKRVMVGTCAALLIVATIGAYLVWPSHKGTTVLIRPGAESAASAAAASDLATRLGGMAAASADLRLTTDPGAADATSMVLSVSATDKTQTERDVTLLAAKDGGILWAAHFEEPKERAADLAPAVSVASARVLGCAADSLSGKFRPLPPAALKLYLTGCAQLPEESDATAADLAPVFEKVVAEAQGFAPAWDKLLRAEASHVVDEPGSPFTSSLRAHLGQTRKLGFDVPGIYLAEQALLPSNRFAERIDHLYRGLERHPHSPFLHQMLAILMMDVGRRNDAINEARTAMDLDPLSPALRSGYIFDLAHSGRFDDASQQLGAAERLWPGSTVVRWTRYSIELRYGDPRTALELVRQGVAAGGEAPSETFLQARLEPTKANIDRAVLAAQELNRQSPFYVSGLALTLATFGRNDEALSVLLSDRWPQYSGYQGEPLFRPPVRGVRQDPRFMQAMARMGFAHYWQQSGDWPDFCFDPSLPYDCRREAAKYS